MALYKSLYTGTQIDKAVGTVLDNDLPSLATKATAAANKAESAAARAEAAAGDSSIYLVEQSHTYNMAAQTETLLRKTCVITELAKADGADGIRVNDVSVNVNGAGTIKLAVYKLTDNGDDTGVLTCVDVIATLKSTSSLPGGVGLYGIDYYTEEDNLYLVALADAAILSCWELTGVTLENTPYFDDADYSGQTAGGTIACYLDVWDAPFMACASVEWDSVSKQTIAEFAATTNTRLDELESGEGGGSGGTGATVTAVDLTRFESEGIIEESYSDGSTVTYTMEFDADGNPIEIKTTDSSGRSSVTTLTW